MCVYCLFSHYTVFEQNDFIDNRPIYPNHKSGRSDFLYSTFIQDIIPRVVLSQINDHEVSFRSYCIMSTTWRSSTRYIYMKKVNNKKINKKNVKLYIISAKLKLKQGKVSK